MEIENALEEKISEFLDKLPFSGAERQITEDYLSGRTGHGGLDVFEFEDLSKLPADPAIRLFRELVKAERRDVAARLFSVLLAKGASTCFRMIPMEVIDPKKGATDLETDSAKKAAVYAAVLGADMYPLDVYSRERLVDIACGKAETLKEAVGFEKNESGNGEFVLYAVYFMRKYQCRCRGESEGGARNTDGTVNIDRTKSANEIENIHKVENLHETENANKTESIHEIENTNEAEDTHETKNTYEIKNPIEPDDIPLLAQYEEIAIESFDKILPPVHPAIQEIKDAVKKGEVTEHILELAALKYGISRPTLRKFGGLAYLNFPLSAKLRDIVKICLAVETDEMLDQMERISSGTPLDMNTGNYDIAKEFGLPSKKYILWAAKKGHDRILEKQLTDDYGTYVRVMEEAEREAADKLFAVIEEKKPSLHKALLEKRRQHGNRNEMEKLLNKLVRNGEDAEVIKAYLRGDTTVDTLYPFAKKQGNNSYYGGEKERKAIEECDKNSLDEAFYRRFQTYMLLRRGSWYLLWFDAMNYPEGGMARFSKEKVKDLFRNFANEGLDVAHLLSGEIMLERDLEISDEGKTLRNRKAVKFHTTAIEIFSQYLKNRREETVRAFAESDVRGRLFGLEVLLQEAEKNKKEILAYLVDQTLEIREMLFDILAGQPDWGKDVAEALAEGDLDDQLFVLNVLSQNVQQNKKEILAYAELDAEMIQRELFDILRFRSDWEEDVKGLLNSKEAVVRKLAIGVLALWEERGADYRVEFVQALEKEENGELREVLEELLDGR